MPTLHLMSGLPCSGKTTLAHKLAHETNALVLSTDAWHLKLFGNDLGQECHMPNHRKVEALLWEVAERVLALGCNVILDFGFWRREDRDAYRQKAEALGVPCRLHYMDVPHAELRRRIQERNVNPPEGVFPIPVEMMELYLSHFEAPTVDEMENGKWKVENG
ncbi:MAG: ATP-binding protein [Clostridia bacterium]|nr:ATP-binding protein [Clostridia bacterium]